MTDDIERAQAREEELPAAPPAQYCKCGEVIPEGRLRAIPGVETCVECQRDIEAQGRWDWGMAEC